jgi:hypothetical protein
MDKPETKAQLEQMKTQNQKLQNQLVSAVYRAMTKRQVTNFKAMLGAPFDATKLQAAQGQQGQSGTETAAQPKSADDDDEAPKAKTAAPAAKAAAPAAKAKSSTTAKRKSLRELRGLDDNN